MSTPEDPLDQIRARLTAATPGPWAAYPNGSIETVPEFDLHRFDTMGLEIAVTRQTAADAEFIANAPADIAYLLAEVERLQPAAKEPKEGRV